MGIEQYRIVQPSAFDKYYDVFLQNSLSQQRYRITLSDDQSYIGIPTCGSFVNPIDPNVSFSFLNNDGSEYRIPFSELKQATRV